MTGALTISSSTRMAKRRWVQLSREILEALRALRRERYRDIDVRRLALRRDRVHRIRHVVRIEHRVPAQNERPQRNRLRDVRVGIEFGDLLDPEARTGGQRDGRQPFPETSPRIRGGLAVTQRHAREVDLLALSAAQRCVLVANLDVLAGWHLGVGERIERVHGVVDAKGFELRRRPRVGIRLGNAHASTDDGEERGKGASCQHHRAPRGGPRLLRSADLAALRRRRLCALGSRLAERPVAQGLRRSLGVFGLHEDLGRRIRREHLPEREHRHAARLRRDAIGGQRGAQHGDRRRAALLPDRHHSRAPLLDLDRATEVDRDRDNHRHEEHSDTRCIRREHDDEEKEKRRQQCAPERHARLLVDLPACLRAEPKHEIGHLLGAMHRAREHDHDRRREPEQRQYERGVSSLEQDGEAEHIDVEVVEGRRQHQKRRREHSKLGASSPGAGSRDARRAGAHCGTAPRHLRRSAPAKEQRSADRAPPTWPGSRRTARTRSARAGVEWRGWQPPAGSPQERRRQ